MGLSLSAATRDMTTFSTIATMLISRDQILRLGVQKTLAGRKDIRLIGPPTGAAEISEYVTREQPHVVILDSQGERDLSGLIHQIKTLVPNRKTVLLMGLDETGWNWETFTSGVDGVLLKMQPPSALIAYIESLCGLATGARDVRSLRANGPSQEDVHRSASQPSNSSQWAGLLTEREREILALMGQGLANKDIAYRLCISVITVRHHLTSIFDKLGVATRQKLLIRAHQYGLIEFSVPA